VGRKRYNKPKRKQAQKKTLTRGQVEKLSRRNAEKLVAGTDNLKSWGKTGWYKSRRLDRWYHYRSSLEQTILTELDEAEEFIVDFDTECFYIPYQFKGATLNYVPDIITKTKNESVFIIEVKPANQLKDPKNKAKWAEAKRWAWRNGARFVVITEKEYDNVEQILQYLEDKEVKKAQELMEWTL
jgi:hypothetical protein